MGLIDKDSIFDLDKNQGPQFSFDGNSTLHNLQSIKGMPDYDSVPHNSIYAPSKLDLNGETPIQYLNNLPG